MTRQTTKISVHDKHIRELAVKSGQEGIIASGGQLRTKSQQNTYAFSVSHFCMGLL